MTLYTIKQYKPLGNMLTFCIFLLFSVFLLVACDKKNTSTVQLAFELNQPPVDIKIDDLRFYVHDFRLIEPNGNRIPITLNEGQTVALINLNPDVGIAVVNGEVEHGKKIFNGLEFRLGVPFELNHADPLTAKPPLDDGSLFWAWQQGYKFLRFDFEITGTDYSFHLGSTGCQSTSAIRPPEQPCAQPNIAKIVLTGFDPTVRPVTTNMHWLTRVLMDSATQSCTGGYSSDRVCSSLIEGLGLNANTGQCVDDCVNQQLFE